MTVSLLVQPLAAADIRPSTTLPDEAKWKEPLSQDQSIIQLLNRITFGPRPGDIERVRQMGVKAFLDEQLHAERIDDSAADARVAALPSLSMSSEELAENYPRPNQAAIFKKQQEDQARAQKAKEEAPVTVPTEMKPEQEGMKSGAAESQPEEQMQKPSTPQPAQLAMAGPQGPQRVVMELGQEEVLRAIYSNRQLNEMMVQFWMNHFNIFAQKGADIWAITSFERDTIRPRALGKFEDLLVATAESPAMLFYLDNWMSATPNPTFAGNYNNRFGQPGPTIPKKQYGVWRPFGVFGGLRPFGQGQSLNPQPRLFGQNARPAKPPQPNRRGLNENYGREVMELHTLGVDGGYTQHDVTEVARCLTGWTIDRPQKGGSFVFRPGMHDFGQKVVLGHTIPAGRGIEDGFEVLHILATQPATARFISLKLCRRFVSDDPPPALVDRASNTFLKTGGDIREVLRTILTSPEFYSQAAFRAKVKSPIELVVSSVRALGAEANVSFPLLQMIARMGEPMFQYQAPTGYPDRASTWINSGSLLTRINFAAMLASNHIPGVTVELGALTQPADGIAADVIVRQVADKLMEGDVSPQTEGSIVKSLDDAAKTNPQAMEPPREMALVTGLLLASPEFQRR